MATATILKYSVKENDKSFKGDGCYKVKIKFTVDNTPETAYFGDNPFRDMGNEEDYMKVHAFLSEKDKDNYDKSLGRGDWMKKSHKIYRDKKKLVWIDKELIYPLHTFINKKKSGAYVFHEYFQKTPYVKALLDAIRTCTDPQELYCILNALTFFWD